MNIMSYLIGAGFIILIVGTLMINPPSWVAGIAAVLLFTGLITWTYKTGVKTLS